MHILRRVIWVSGFAASLAVQSGALAADAPEGPISTWSVPPAASAAPAAPSTAPSSTVPSPPGAQPSVAVGRGVAVLAVDGATDAAWRLAARVYRGPLRPTSLDEVHARALVGDAPASGASGARDVQDLAETRAAIHGEDAPSRRLLASLAAQLGVEAVVVVQKDASSGTATARVFLASNGAFDAARYAEDNGSWEPTATSLERTLRVDSRADTQPGAKTTDAPVGPTSASSNTPPNGEPRPADGSKAFYKSVWFWGALGAAVFAGGAIFLATRDNGDGSGPMHVQVKVPR